MLDSGQNKLKKVIKASGLTCYATVIRDPMYGVSAGFKFMDCGCVESSTGGFKCFVLHKETPALAC